MSKAPSRGSHALGWNTLVLGIKAPKHHWSTFLFYSIYLYSMHFCHQILRMFSTWAERLTLVSSDRYTRWQLQFYNNTLCCILWDSLRKVMFGVRWTAESHKNNLNPAALLLCSLGKCTITNNFKHFW